MKLVSGVRTFTVSQIDWQWQTHSWSTQN